MPSAPPCGISTSALKVYDALSSDGASPFGVPVTSPDQVNSLRPAARLGRGKTARVATEASSGSFLPEQRFQLLELVRIRGGDVVVLCPILGQIIEFVRVAGRILAHCPDDHPRRPYHFGARDPAVMMDRMVTHHLEVLRSMGRWCVGVLRIEGVRHADAFGMPSTTSGAGMPVASRIVGTMSMRWWNWLRMPPL